LQAVFVHFIFLPPRHQDTNDYYSLFTIHNRIGLLVPLCLSG
jgi:hypothetical protein